MAEVLDLLTKYGPRAKIVAGGTDLMVLAHKGLLKADVLISLKRLADYRCIRENGNEVRIGALTTLRDLEQSALVTDRFPALADAVRRMAAVQVRNMATMAGNIVNAAPSADTAPPLLVSGARLNLVSPSGERTVAVENFFTGPKTTIIRFGEVLTEFVLPRPAPPCGQAFWKHSRRKAMDLAVVNIAVHLDLEADLLTCRQARIAMGVAGPTPRRAPEGEASLVGRPVTPELLSQAGRNAAAESCCRDSVRGQAWYRREIIQVMVRRLGLLALERARFTAGQSQEAH